MASELPFQWTEKTDKTCPRGDASADTDTTSPVSQEEVKEEDTEIDEIQDEIVIDVV